MFRRTFWFTAGAAAGVWATTKVNRKIKQLTPESLAAQAANKAIDAGHRLKDFALDVRAGMAQREAELGEALGLEHDPDAELPAQRRVVAIENRAPGSRKHQITSHQTYENGSYTYNRNEDH
ncbi:DUF6167 family protein [Streptomyces indicus]|uniref:Secreted protein n=1 Tax=Streptomyces indicus TaxID=417292 RepID=A0A1G8XDG2_9ACTN|nr:DUF6167 family protein [Streptomyces indicus]SDJ88602.1 hypothetical protein SAMN05421806_103143 [Streptomyces indicus]